MTKRLGFLLLVVLVCAAIFVPYPSRAQFPFPVSLSSDAPTIRISLLGSYRGGFFSTVSAQGPAAYDPRRQRLYVISQVRTGIEILDLRDPSRPTKVGSIELGPIGLGAQSVAFHDRTLAVPFRGRQSRALDRCCSSTGMETF